MDTSWWFALAAVVVVAAVAALADGVGRVRRPRLRRRARGRSGAPVPGEVWWARIPLTEGPDPRERPCLVVSARGAEYLVIRVTSGQHGNRPGVLALPPGSVGSVGGVGGASSYLDTEQLRSVPAGAFRRRAGRLDPLLWDQVRHLTGSG